MLERKKTVSWGFDMFGNRKVDLLMFGDFSHDYSLVVEFVNSADKGKTVAMVATMFELLRLGYSGNEVHANMWVDVEGFHEYDNAGMREFLHKVLREGLRHKIIMMDEIDSIYPSRGFKDKLQTEEILRLNQMTKTENWFLFTRHLGSSIDKYIRDCTNISVEPVYNPVSDTLVLTILDAVDNEDEGIERTVDVVSDLFCRYKRWKENV